MNWSPSRNGGLFPEPPTGRTMTTPGLVTGNNGKASHSEKNFYIIFVFTTKEYVLFLPFRLETPHKFSNKCIIFLVYLLKLGKFETFCLGRELV